MNSWKLIVPPEDWQHPLEIDPSQLPLLEEIARRLALRITRDDQRGKLYLGLPGDSSEGVLYPVGKRFPKAHLSEAEAARYGVTGIYSAAPLLALDPDELLSEHFRAREFFPQDASYRFLRIAPELIERLEQLRKKLGDRPITIHSAYRPPAYNRSVGGVSNSAHIDGLAADISAAGTSTDALYRLCDQVIGEGGGVGYYPHLQFVHIDVRGRRGGSRFYSRWTG
mgnify:CR=1 FL=1